MEKFTDHDIEMFNKFREITDEQVTELKQKVHHNLSLCIMQYFNLSVIDPNDFTTKCDEIKIGVDSFRPLIGFRILVSYQNVMKYEIDVDNNGNVSTVRKQELFQLKRLKQIAY